MVVVVITHAIQIQPESPPQDPNRQIPGDELARLRCCVDPAGAPDGVGDRGGRGRLERACYRRAGWSANLFGDAIETCLTLRLVFHQPLRQTGGLMRSIADVLKVDIAIPDHTTLSRPGGGLTILPKCVDSAEPLHLLVDSTGLKIYGEGEWLNQKHGIRSRRRWRKLHLGMNAVTHEIVAVELTPDDVGDDSEIPDLLDQIDADVASLTADGADDGEAVYDAVAERHPEAVVIIPPRATAVPSETTATQRNQRTAASRSDSAHSADRVKNRLQRAQPDDWAWHAGLRSDPMTRRPKGEAALSRVRAPKRTKAGTNPTGLHAPYADYAIASAPIIARKPSSAADVDAASVPVIAVTAWQALFEHTALVRGQSVLIHGAAGSVGAFAVQFAHQARVGARMYRRFGGTVHAPYGASGTA